PRCADHTLSYASRRRASPIRLHARAHRARVDALRRRSPRSGPGGRLAEGSTVGHAGGGGMMQLAPETIAPPLVSVVVPARAADRFLEPCPASIERQQFRPERLEVVVVENGSRDRTRAIAEACAARDPRVRLVVSNATNQAEAMNAGIRAARGTVVARVDAHSHVPPDYVAQVVEALDRHPGAAGGGGAFPPAGETLPRRVAGLGPSSPLPPGRAY